MSTVLAALHAIDERFPIGKAAGWDAVGLQVGDPTSPAGRIAVCHEATDAVASAAIAAEVDVLVAYHPLLFVPSQRFVAGSGPAGRAWRLARAGISLIVVHTAFDVAPGGAADCLAAALGLVDVAPFGPLWGPDRVKVITFVPPRAVDAVVDSMAAAGAGAIGRYSGCSFHSSGVGTFRPEPGAQPAVGAVGDVTRADEVRVEMVADARDVGRVVAALVRTHPYEEPAYDIIERSGDAGFVGRHGDWSGSLGDLADVVANRLSGRPTVRIAGDPSRRVARVAVLPGSGATELDAAAAIGADVMVTGDVKHHDARRALERGMAVIDPGHAATEKPGLAALYAAVAALGTDTVDLTDVDPDPWMEDGHD